MIKVRIVFNAQTANTISVMDPKSQSLVEYHVPSKNPYWGDCDPGTGLMIADCGWHKSLTLQLMEIKFGLLNGLKTILE